MKNLEFQATKEAKPETNPKIVILKKYQDFLDTFLRKNSDILLFYQKYNLNIILKEEKKHNNTFLYIMLLEKLYIMKYYLEFYLTKRFIQASSAYYLSPVIFVKKLSRKIWLSINYQKLNIITKNNQYSIFFIEKILA